MPHKSPGAARALGISTSRLWNLIRSGRLAAPTKDPSGDYIWYPEDVERARVALLVDRRRKSRIQERARVPRGV